jgi:nucleotide sugar dehydrogenase
MTKVAVVGMGYVGLPLALLAERKGYEVVGIDIDTEKISQLEKKQVPFFELSLAEHLQTAKNILFTTDFSPVAEASIVIICVPTPVYGNHMPNLEPVIGATEAVAPHLKAGHLIILESTVNPGVSESIVLPVLEKKSGLTGGKDFSLAHCPERINPGDPKWHVENINRVVGSLDATGLTKAVKFYESILTGSVMRMGSLKEAEAVKVVENSFRDINIAFVNELARSFTKLGIDVVRVIDGAATKPFAFMAHYPGCGVGGHCIPVDPYYLIEYAKEHGFNHDFLSLARRINNDMPAFTVERLQEALNEEGLPLRGTPVAVLGVSYKPNIADCRESPSFEIIRILEEKGTSLRVFDPYVPTRSDVSTLEDAIAGATAIVIATAHDEFKSIDPALLSASGVKVVVDGRNCMDVENYRNGAIRYKGVGR